MKIRSYIVALTAFAVALCACDDLLKEKDSYLLYGDGTYRTSEQVIASLYGVYGELQGNQLYGGNNIRDLGDMCGDVLHGASGMGKWIGFTFTPTDNTFLNWWRANYKLITNANDLINNIGRCEQLSPDSIRVISAEAKFLRALGYFNLVRSFGPVPLVLDSPHDVLEVRYPYRATLAELYALMISDLSEAVKVLPLYDTGKTLYQTGRATRGSAAALMAKVYLTKGYSPASYYPGAAEPTDFRNAADLCDDLIEGNYGPYGLLENYSDVFSPNNEGNREMIFVVKFDFLPNTPSNIIMRYSHSNLYSAVTSGAAFAPITHVRSFDGNSAKNAGGTAASNPANKAPSNDRRFNYGFIMFRPYAPEQTISNQWYFQKYQDELKTSSGQDRCDFPVLRFSDVLLMHSEALHSGNIAVSKYGRDKYYGVNQVRARACIDPGFPDTKLAPVADGTYSGGTYGGDYIKVILQERAWELNCEGHRHWDLVRTGKLQEYIVAYTTNDSFGNQARVVTPEMPLHNLYPMPQQEIDINPNLVPPGQTNNGYKSYAGQDPDDEE